MRSLLVLLILAGAACAGPGRGTSEGSAGSNGRERIQGTVRLVGSAPMNVRLVLQHDGGSTPLAGAMADELRRLTGAEVSVVGHSEGAVFMIEEYRIVAVDGRPVIMGVVESTAGEYVQLRTPEGETVYVVGLAGQFRAGQKVWVQGPAGVIAQTFGTLQP